MKTDGKDYKGADPVKKAEASAAKPRTLKEWLSESRDSFIQAIPQGTINIDRFIAAAAMEIMSNPKLVSCTKPSLSASLLMSARYGLEVGPLLGQAWLIPYNESRNVDGRWVKEMTCHFQLGYKGLIVLARRSQTIKTIACEVVYDNDIFEVELGMGRKLTHKIDIRKERGEPIAYYCLVELENGGVQFGVMSRKDVEKHRDTFSKGYDANDKENTWVKNFDAMALKTIAIRTLKLCPISVEALEAVNREEQMDSGMRNVTPTAAESMALLPETTAEPVPAESAKEPETVESEVVDEKKKADPVKAEAPAKEAPKPEAEKPMEAPAKASSKAEAALFEGMEFPEPPEGKEPDIF